MKKYKIYALIHGHILKEGEIFGCEVKIMSFTEQKKRNFTPILSTFSNRVDEDFHKTYDTFLPYVDTLKIKSEHIIICEIEERDVYAALGGAIRRIDRIARFLTLSNLEDMKRKHGRDKGHFEPYVYQVNKVYQIDPEGKEIEKNPKLESGFVYLPNRPESNKWRNEDTENFLNESYQFDDDVFQRSLKYLYGATTGGMVNNSPEKIALDHMKSIEIIIDSLSKKDTFKKRLAHVKNILNLSQEEVDAIDRYWTKRSKFSDTAHPAPFDRSEMYPNQFPIPDGVMYSGGMFDYIASNVLLKYFHYKKGIFTIDIFPVNAGNTNSSKEGELSEIYTISTMGTTFQNHYVFYTSETANPILRNKIKKAFSENLKIDEKLIEQVVELPQNDDFISERRIRLKVKSKII